MFGRKKKIEPPPLAASSADLGNLAPYANLSPTVLQELASAAETLHSGPGLTDADPGRGNVLFLVKGAVQIQTAAGGMIMLRADTPQARFALPPAASMIGLLAAEPCTFLRVPLVASHSAGAGDTPAAQAPGLTPPETAALQELSTLFASRQCELPSLPDLAIKISQAIDDTETTNDDIGRLIQLDPALTARILSVVNSAAFGGMSRITNIQQATARLGRKKVRSLVYSCLLKSIFKIQHPSLKKRMEALWQHSAHVAALSFALGRATPGIDPEQAMLSGLIHEIGAVAVIGGVSRFLVLAERDEVLDHVIASLRVDVGLRTLAQWGLQDELQDVVRDAENWWRVGSAIPENADVVILAQMHALIGSPQAALLPRINAVPAFSKLADGALTPRQSLTILDEAAEDVREVHALIASD